MVFILIIKLKENNISPTIHIVFMVSETPGRINEGIFHTNFYPVRYVQRSWGHICGYTRDRCSYKTTHVTVSFLYQQHTSAVRRGLHHNSQWHHTWSSRVQDYNSASPDWRPRSHEVCVVKGPALESGYGRDVLVQHRFSCGHRVVRQWHFLQMTIWVLPLKQDRPPHPGIRLPEFLEKVFIGTHRWALVAWQDIDKEL